MHCGGVFVLLPKVARFHFHVYYRRLDAGTMGVPGTKRTGRTLRARLAQAATRLFTGAPECSIAHERSAWRGALAVLHNEAARQ